MANNYDYEGSQPVFLTGNELKMIRQIRDMMGIFMFLIAINLLVLANAAFG